MFGRPATATVIPSSSPVLDAYLYAALCSRPVFLMDRDTAKSTAGHSSTSRCQAKCAARMVAAGRWLSTHDGTIYLLARKIGAELWRCTEYQRSASSAAKTMGTWKVVRVQTRDDKLLALISARRARLILMNEFQAGWYCTDGGAHKARLLVEFRAVFAGLAQWPCVAWAADTGSLWDQRVAQPRHAPSWSAMYDNSTGPVAARTHPITS